MPVPRALKPTFSHLQTLSYPTFSILGMTPTSVKPSNPKPGGPPDTSPTRGVQPFGVSGTHWKKKSCLGPHIKYTKSNENKQIS